MNQGIAQRLKARGCQYIQVVGGQGDASFAILRRLLRAFVQLLHCSTAPNYQLGHFLNLNQAEPSFTILNCFHSTTCPRWWQAPRICNNVRIGKNDENLWLFVVGIIWTRLACFPASKAPFKYLTTGLKGVNFVLEINSSPPSPPKLASTLGLASGLPTGSIEIDRHSFTEMGGDVVFVIKPIYLLRNWTWWLHLEYSFR